MQYKTTRRLKFYNLLLEALNRVLTDKSFAKEFKSFELVKDNGRALDITNRMIDLLTTSTEVNQTDYQDIKDEYIAICGGHGEFAFEALDMIYYMS